jgi:hypothetical protein
MLLVQRIGPPRNPPVGFAIYLTGRQKLPDFRGTGFAQEPVDFVYLGDA